jgi:D-sedoheptulose 7-phosphate isomerase
MSMSKYQNNLKEHLEVFSHVESLGSNFQEFVKQISNSMQVGGKLLICGNGGSAADAQHLAAEFTGRFTFDRAPLPAIALTTDTSAITCIGNDYSFNEIFSRQISAIGGPTDILLLISTSGNSKNLLTAADAAKSKGMSVLGLLGKDGGKLMNECDEVMVVNSWTTARIQEAHIFLLHEIVGAVELIMTEEKD